MADARRGDERFPGLETLLVPLETEPPRPLQDVVVLVLIGVRVRGLRLAGPDAVQVELCPGRGGQEDLRHLLRREPRVVRDADLHVPPPSRSARPTSSTGCRTSSSKPS